MRLLAVTLLVFALSGHAWCNTQPHGRWVRSSRIHSSAPFQAVGVYWSEVVNGGVRVRASMDGESWTGWIHSPGEALETGGMSSGLVYFGEGYQYLEVDGVADPQVLLIDPGASPSPITPAAIPAPSIVTREQWGCTPSTCPAKDPPLYTSVTHLIVHHTDGVNNATDWAAVVRSIWVLHVQGNGWNDIGYNYLIDPNGLLYEGRAGGDGVLGAHFSGVNSGTMGVALLGTYIDKAPTALMIETLTSMLAWQADKWRLDPAGESLHASSGLMLNVISGHRDASLSPKATSTTECPGNTGYTLLPAVRNEVARRMPTCVRSVGERNRCISAQGSDVAVPVVVSDSGCQPEVTVPPGAQWIVAEVSGADVRLHVAPNGGERRSAVVSVSGQNISIAQASASEQNVSCIGQRGTVNAADFDERPVAPGSLVSLFGENFSDGTSIAVNGKAVTVQYAGPNQINAWLPAGIAIGTNYFTATTNGVTGPPTGFWVTEAMPAIFADAQRHAIAVNADDGTLNMPGQPVRAGRPVTIYLTGAGAVNSTALHTTQYAWSATIGGAAAPGLFLGLAPSFMGLYQANILVPPDLAAGEYTLLLTVDGVTARGATLSVAP